MTGNVVDFIGPKVESNCLESLTDMLETSVRGAIEQIAILHDGKPDDWIDRKTDAVIAIVQAMIELSKSGIRIPVPASLSPEDQQVVCDSVVS